MDNLESMVVRHDADINNMKDKLSNVEESQKQLNELINTVSVLAKSVEQIATEVGKQGKKLEELSSVPVKRYNKIWGYVVSSIISLLLGGVIQALLANIIH